MRFGRIVAISVAAFVLCFAVAVNAQTTIRFANSAGSAVSQAYMREAIAEFEREHPHIKVELIERPFAELHEKLMVEIATNTAPDIAFISWAYFRDFAEAGLLHPLQSLIERDNQEVYIEDFWPTTLEHSQFEGVQYGLPLQVGGKAMFYNADILNEIGYGPPQPGWTWADDFLDMARKATVDADGDGMRERFGISAITAWDFWSNLILSEGGWIIDPATNEFALNTPEAVRGVQFVVDLDLLHDVIPRAGEVSGQPFQQGVQAFGLQSPPQIGQLEQAATFEWDVTLPPSGSARAVLMGGNLPLVIPATSVNIEEAWEFIKFITSSEQGAIQANLGLWGPPRRSSIFEITNPKMISFAQTLEYQMPMTNILFDEIRNVMTREIGTMIKGEQSVENGLERANTQLNALLKARLGQ